MGQNNGGTHKALREAAGNAIAEFATADKNAIANKSAIKARRRGAPRPWPGSNNMSLMQIPRKISTRCGP